MAKLFLINYHVQHPEAMAGSNTLRLVVANSYEEAKAKIIAVDNAEEIDYQLQHKFFDNNEPPKPLSACFRNENLDSCYNIIDKVDGLEIKIKEE